MRIIAIAIAAGALAAADVVVLLGVAAARHGTPDATLEVTELELSMRDRPEKDSAVTLSVSVQPSSGTPWVTREKLDELGVPPAKRGAKAVFAALELMPEVKDGGPRLVMIDAAAAPGTLRARYRDRERYAIVPAIARRHTKNFARDGSAGQIGIEPTDVYVPPEYFGVFRDLQPQHGGTGPRYAVKLCFADKGDVWMCGARRN